MGVLIKLIDAVLLLFFLAVILPAPTFDAQVCFPSKFFPNFLVDLNLWFTSEYSDYLLIEKPSFFVGLMWLELNLYAILVRGKPWFNSTCLVYGVSVFIGMNHKCVDDYVDLANIRVRNWCLNLFLILFMLQVVVLAELILSSRITNVLMMMYLPFLGFAILAILRGLLPCSCQTKMNTGVLALGRKKRA
ncbi:hypothetical protein HYC85_011987 [Camellia sinensis]|uniref:EXPERA domain-containing protein n=1 Tax=Camellia sinensis TaxID=4442 RepID=A0A7J7HDJ4_CAMSI|nr:hypothetical protein HYC85_011987 [Camellia sinensis]